MNNVDRCRMREAEALGDRIGIISAGTVRCLGSPLFLKARLGSGTALSLHIPSITNDDVSTLAAFIQQIIPTSSIVSVTQNDLTFRIPNQVGWEQFSVW